MGKAELFKEEDVYEVSWWDMEMLGYKSWV